MVHYVRQYRCSREKISYYYGAECGASKEDEIIADNLTNCRSLMKDRKTRNSKRF